MPFSGVAPIEVSGRAVFRLFTSRDRASGANRGPFFHASLPAAAAVTPEPAPDRPTGGRFDLRSPRGTCYLASNRLAAWVEVFRGTRMVDRTDARSRRLLQSHVPRRLALADITNRGAVAGGVSLDPHAGSDRAVSQSFAAAIDEDRRFRGIWSWTRHDPSKGSNTLALFDDQGDHAPYGWPWRITIIDPLDDFELLTELASCGLGVAGVPHDLSVIAPGQLAGDIRATTHVAEEPA
jgi:hypothetical protein